MQPAKSCRSIALHSVIAALGAALAACGGSSSQPPPDDASLGTGGSNGGAGGSGTGGSASDAGLCGPCPRGRMCCDGKCVNLVNDPTNCGACGTHCEGATPYCDGTCQAAPCERDSATCANGSCCGSECCSQGQLCCNPQGPLDRGPVCYTPTAEQPSCPPGCAPLCISDRTLKREIEPVDRFAVLDAVSRLPVSTWSYRADPAGVRHMGPMAQDFKAAFGLGDTDRAYHAIDAHGVTIAAIQALYDISLEQSRKIERLEHENERLQSRVSALEGTRESGSTQLP